MAAASALRRLLICLATLIGVIPAASAATITVYTAYEDDEAAAFLALAKVDMPDLEVRLLRLSTGDLTARILAEASSPRHDVIWGQAVSNLEDPRLRATLEPYEPDSLARLPAQFRGAGGAWFAPTGYLVAFCVNHDRLKAKGLPMPTSWADLAKPVYRGELILPDPRSSGTGFVQVASILQVGGEQAGWEMLRALDRNTVRYVASGSQPCYEASSGTVAIGASFDHRAVKIIADHLPITMVIPSEGAGNELEGNALVATSQNKEAARRFLDWTLSENAIRAYVGWKAIVAPQAGYRPLKFRLAGMPENAAEVMLRMDFAKVARDRPQILSRWEKEFGR